MLIIEMMHKYAIFKMQLYLQINKLKIEKALLKPYRQAKRIRTK